MLLDVDRALRKLVRLVRPVADSETVPLADAVGRIAAEDVVAPIDLPPFDASAMDGYAVHAAGLNHQRLKRFAVIGESLAGHAAQRTVTKGTAIRIFTGAALPAGANAVVIQEDAVRRGDAMTTAEPVQADQHVRRRGHDVRRGMRLCRKGRKLSTYDLSWLAACGIDRVRVVRCIRVAIFSTGDELATAGGPLAAGQVYDSNRFAVSSLLREKSADIVDFGCLPDDPEAIRSTLLEASQDADLIVASGGVSVGDADFVKAAVEEVGSLDFWKIALKPGKPLAVGRIGEALFFGLPGNPVSTIVTYLLFVAPAVDLLGGARLAPLLTLPATIDHPVRHAKGRREYMRGVVRVDGGRLMVAATGDQSSNRLATFAHANCLIVVSEDSADLKSGDMVGIVPLSGEAAHPLRAANALRAANG